MVGIKRRLIGMLTFYEFSSISNPCVKFEHAFYNGSYILKITSGNCGIIQALLNFAFSHTCEKNCYL